MLCEDCTAAEFGNVANATRRRRRILKSGFFLTLNVKTEILTFKKKTMILKLLFR